MYSGDISYFLDYSDSPGFSANYNALTGLLPGGEERWGVTARGHHTITATMLSHSYLVNTDCLPPTPANTIRPGLSAGVKMTLTDVDILIDNCWDPAGTAGTDLQKLHQAAE